MHPNASLLCPRAGQPLWVCVPVSNGTRHLKKNWLCVPETQGPWGGKGALVLYQPRQPSQVLKDHMVRAESPSLLQGCWQMPTEQLSCVSHCGGCCVLSCCAI